MNALIGSTLDDLLTLFARTMASEGKPRRSAMEAKLQHLCDEAVKQRDRSIIMLINGHK